MKVTIQINSQVPSRPEYLTVMDLEDPEDREALYTILRWQANIVARFGPRAACTHIDVVGNPEVQN